MKYKDSVRSLLILIHKGTLPISFKVLNGTEKPTNKKGWIPNEIEKPQFKIPK